MKKLFTLFAFACICVASFATTTAKYNVTATITADGKSARSLTQVLDVTFNGTTATITLPAATLGNWTMDEQTVVANNATTTTGTVAVETAINFKCGTTSYVGRTTKAATYTVTSGKLSMTVEATVNGKAFTVKYEGTEIASRTQNFNVTANLKKENDQASLRQVVKVIWFDSIKKCDIILPAAELRTWTMAEQVVKNASYTDAGVITLPAAKIVIKDAKNADVNVTVNSTTSTASLSGSALAADIKAASPAGDAISIKYEGLDAAAATKLNSAHMATYSSDSAFKITTSGVKAYTCLVDGSEIVLLDLDVTKAIPAKTGILIYAPNADKVEFAASIETPQTINASFNSLVATTSQTTVSGTCYVLSNDASFKQYTGKALDANRAYIPGAKSAVKSLNIVLDDADAISTVKAEKANVKFIENGKVVIVKNGQKFNVAGQIVK